jgi:hypothetical protein
MASKATFDPDHRAEDDPKNHSAKDMSGVPLDERWARTGPNPWGDVGQGSGRRSGDVGAGSKRRLRGGEEGRWIAPNGFVRVRDPRDPPPDPNYPEARRRPFVFEHKLVAEAKIGRPLQKNERVRHINRNKSDNRPENLEVVTINLEKLPENLAGKRLDQATLEIIRLRRPTQS